MASKCPFQPKAFYESRQNTMSSKEKLLFLASLKTIDYNPLHIE